VISIVYNIDIIKHILHKITRLKIDFYITGNKRISCLDERSDGKPYFSYQAI